MPAPLDRLTYISRFSRDLSGDDVRALVDHSAKKNAQLDITGVLMASGGIFYQVLEGPRDALTNLYSRIQEDERHVDILLLTEERDIDERAFGTWSMRAISADEIARQRLAPVRQQLDSVMKQRATLAEATLRLHQEVWGELERIVRTGDTQVGMRDGVVTEIE
jgi:hypothetical protein